MAMLADSGAALGRASSESILVRRSLFPVPLSVKFCRLLEFTKKSGNILAMAVPKPPGTLYMPASELGGSISAMECGNSSMSTSSLA